MFAAEKVSKSLTLLKTSHSLGYLACGVAYAVADPRTAPHARIMTNGLGITLSLRVVANYCDLGSKRIISYILLGGAAVLPTSVAPVG